MMDAGHKIEREILWSSEAPSRAQTGKMTTPQINSVEHVLRGLPHHGEEVHEWRVESGHKRVYLFAATRIIGERGAQILCRERYLFVIGVRGAIEQLSPENRKRVDITRWRPGRRW